MPLFPANVKGAFCTIAPGPDGSVVVAAWGRVGPGTEHYGIFFGKWSRETDNFEFKRAKMPSDSQKQMAYISLDSYRMKPEVIYALSGHANDFVYTVLKSQNGGED